MPTALAAVPKPLPSFPQELYDLIIDCVAELGDKRATLRSCHSVSVAFCRRSRSHLFKRFYIRNTPDTALPDVTNSLSGALQVIRPTIAASAPAWLRLGIAPYIQSFELNIFVPRDADHRTVNVLDRNGQFASLLNSLHGTGYGIRHFALHLHSRKGVRWDKFPPRVVRACRNLFISPNFTSLSLCDTLNFPTTLLLGTRIQELHLAGPRPDETTLPAFSHWHKQPGMSDNCLREVFASSSWSVEPKQHRRDFYTSMFQNIKTLSYMLDDEETVARANIDLFAVCRDAVEDLRFHYTTRFIEWSHLAGYFPGKFKRLHTLNVSSGIDDYEYSDDLNMAISRCCRIVDIVGPESLRNITFDFPCQSDDIYPEPMWEEIWDINWTPLGTLITERLKFHPNFMVRLIFDCYFYTPPSGALEDPPALQEAITSIIAQRTGVDPKHLHVEVHVCVF